MGFISTTIPFLPTNTPTDTLPDPLNSPDLSKVEKEFLIFKKAWLASPYSTALQTTIAQVIRYRQNKPIKNVICLGIGSDAWMNGNGRDIQQAVIFDQIVTQLAVANPEILNNIVIQDPNMIPAWRAFFENRNLIVMENPRATDTPEEIQEKQKALSYFDYSTFVYNAWVQPGYLWQYLWGLNLEHTALYVGFDQLKYLGQLNLNAGSPREETLMVPSRWLNPAYSISAPMPCLRPNSKKVRGPYHGIDQFSIVWRAPKQSELQLQSLSATAYNAACIVGFPYAWLPFSEFRDIFNKHLNYFDQETINRFLAAYVAAKQLDKYKGGFAEWWDDCQSDTELEEKNKWWIDRWIGEVGDRIFVVQTFRDKIQGAPRFVRDGNSNFGVPT